jgi:hypothetical protein
LQRIEELWAQLSTAAAHEYTEGLELLERTRVGVLQAAGAPVEALVDAMRAHAGALRARGNVHAAFGAILEIGRFVRTAGRELAGPAGWWRMEESRVLWDLKQERQAIKLLDLLLLKSEATPPDAGAN